jgi:exopolyphosphatase/guanosine-5'-triphosphate,3'-diphosphate pyrophosphatase
MASRIAAIDVGSNAIRFYVVEPTEGSSYRVVENLREPIRLGGDVFLTGTIREENIQKAESAFRRFTRLLSTHSVKTVREVESVSTRCPGRIDLSNAGRFW